MPAELRPDLTKKTSVTDLTRSRLAALHSNVDLLAHILRGIEKEGLRVDPTARLARTPHPHALGAALTHASITTDYSEALMELITGTHNSVEGMLAELGQVHRHVYSQLADELIWNQSMPAMLPPEAEIPIAWYGTSNTGMLKHVYRRGLAERYGKTMQCIAGVHYNFSLPDALWQVLEMPGTSLQDQRSAGYIGLIRNFTRYSWLLMYLFGAAPAVSSAFMAGKPANLDILSDDTCYLPFATSLRMSDLGYTSQAQSQLKLCYDNLDEFLERLHTAVTTPWPHYQAIGTHRDGQWIQLNTNVLQIENEYYSTIRPKRATGRCERPITAMAQRGVQYVEVRCLDIDPFEPTGISATTARLTDAFLLFCAASESPLFGGAGYCAESERNFAQVVKQGRKPGLTLERDGQATPLAQWGSELLALVRPYAQVLDTAHGTTAYMQAVDAQEEKLANPDTTPSARVLAGIKAHGGSFTAYTLAQSAAHAKNLREQPLSAAETAHFAQERTRSLQEQASLESNDEIDFDTYVTRYEQALQAPVKSKAA